MIGLLFFEGDILIVKKCGVFHSWFSPWDVLVEWWWGVQEVFMDLAMRPELDHLAIDRLVNANISRLDQWERLGLLI
jgi:hypothetical protein